MIVAMALYLLFWEHGNVRGQRKEAERIEALRASGWLRERQEETEKEGKEKRGEGRRAESEKGEEVEM